MFIIKISFTKDKKTDMAFMAKYIYYDQRVVVASKYSYGIFVGLTFLQRRQFQDLFVFP